MPKQISSISDAQMEARLSQVDPGEVWVTARQAGIVLNCSLNWLEEARKHRRPPPFSKRDPSKAKSSVFYELGGLLQYKRSCRVAVSAPAPVGAGATSRDNLSDAEKNALKRGEKRLAHNMLAFVTQGKADDEYPFTLWRGEFLDFFDSLTMGLDDTAQCGWYTLDEYLTERRNQARRELRSQSLSAGATLGQLRSAFPGDNALGPDQVAQFVVQSGAGSNDAARAALLDGVIVPGLREDGESWKAPVSSVAAALDAAMQGEASAAVSGGGSREATRRVERIAKVREFWGLVLAAVDKQMADGWTSSAQPRPLIDQRGGL